MNWEAIGAVGEILGAIAVLVTLGYLAAQIRQNTRAMRAAAVSAVYDTHTMTEYNERYIMLVLKAQRSEALTAEERVHMVERFTTIMRGLESLWYQQQLGVLSPRQFENHLDLVRWATSTPVARRMWIQVAPNFEPGFRELVDRESIADGAPRSRMADALAAIDPAWQPDGRPE